jgi:hypothetical protein
VGGRARRQHEDRQDNETGGYNERGEELGVT